MAPSLQRTDSPVMLTWQQFLVEHSVDGIIVVDELGTIREFNRAAEGIFRCSSRTVLGENFDRFIPSRMQVHHRGLFRTFVHQEVGGHEMRNRDPVVAVREDGEEFFADIAVVPVSFERQPAIACVIRDLTDRMDAEAAAMQTEKMESLRILSAGLAHDFNNILTTILGNAGLAMSMVGEDSPAHDVVNDVREAAVRAAEMVQQMLRFAGRGEPLMQDVDVSHVVVEMCRLLRGSVRPGVAITVATETGLPLVNADPTFVGQIVMNLVVNASEAVGEAGGSVCVGVRKIHADRRTLRACYGASRALPGEFVCIEVADTGRGMDRATRARVFDPFFSTKFAGRGLGLASVLGIVRTLGGGVRVMSKPGRGSLFRVLLPIAPGSQCATDGASATGAAPSR